MIANATARIEDLTLLVEQEIHVHASLEDTFAALLEQLGPANEVGDGRLMPMVLEAWPGGRWYRDLGNDNGHFWAHVQAIKRPTLLEFTGPLMMSHPVANNVQYRLSEEPRRDADQVPSLRVWSGAGRPSQRRVRRLGLHPRQDSRACGSAERSSIDSTEIQIPHKNTRRSYVDYTSIDRRIHCTGASRGI